MTKTHDRRRTTKTTSEPPTASDNQTCERATCWALFHAIIAHSDRVILCGPPGTGKTRAALSTALHDGQESYSLILTEETPAAEIRGHWIPSPTGFDWHDGPAIRAWRTGGRLVLDEIDHASGDVMSLLMTIVDAQETARLTLPTGETVRPAPGFSVVATMNGNPDQLPPALRDRFTVVITIDAVNEPALAALPAHIRRAAQATALLPAERRLSVRSWHHFAHLIKHVSKDTAAVAVFGERAKDVLDALRLASTDL